MGKAVVTDVGGLPCFSVPKNWDTRGGIPLETLDVTKENGPDAAIPYEQVWAFHMEPPGESITTWPDKCFAYGMTPKRATRDVLTPLQAFQVYSVFIHAIPDGTSLRGYDAKFCIKPAVNGSSRVLTVPWDDAAGRWRYDLCAPPG